MPLKCTLIPSALTDPIVSGCLPASDLELTVTTSNVDENSRRMIAGEYDVAEMSMGTFVQARARGGDFTALPVFLGRRFLQPCIAYRRGVTLTTPQDLRGKRILFPQYWMTSSVWHRGIMEHEYGVSAREVTWLTTQSERMDAAFTPGVNVTQIEEWSLPSFFERVYDLVDSESVDVVFFPRSPEDRSRTEFLFADPVEASLEYYRRTGVYPLMHAIVVRASLLRDRPALSGQLIELFSRAKREAYERPGERHMESPIATRSFAEAQALLGGDPYPFGVEANRDAIEAFLTFAAEQRVSDRKLSVGEAFGGVA